MPRVSEERLAARRQQILSGARAAFARHGYEGATVRILEEEIGLSRGAIFHHFPDKSALFFALARADADAMAATVAAHGLVQVMRNLVEKPDAGWLGIQLEISRRIRTDVTFREAWAERGRTINSATRTRLQRQKEAGVLRSDVDVEVLANYLELFLDGLISRLAAGEPVDRLGPVLDLLEGTVRLRR
jgi:AcrR family transcriptional regulator